VVEESNLHKPVSFGENVHKSYRGTSLYIVGHRVLKDLHAGSRLHMSGIAKD
jgi:hypothetical protein